MKPSKQLLLVGLLSASQPACASYNSPEHDLRIAVRLEMLRNAVRGLSGTRYRADYSNNGRICASPNIELDLQQIGVASSSYLHGVDGRSGLSLSLSLRPRLLITRCDNWDFGQACDASTSLVDFSSDLTLEGWCKFKILVKRFTWPVYQSIPSPLRVNSTIPVELGEAVEAPDRRIEFEYGAARDGTWVPSPHRVRNAQLVASTGGVLGKRVISKTISDALFEADSPVLYGDFSVGKRGFHKASDLNEVYSELASDNPLRDGEFIGFSLSPTFFGQGSAAPSGNGLFGSVLPLRVHGFQKVGKLSVGFSAVLTEASVAFVDPGNPKIIVDFGVTSAQLFDRDVVGKNYPVKEVHARLVLNAPEIDENGAVNLTPESFIISIEGSRNLLACICFDTGNIASALKGKLPVLKVEQRLEVALPECIDVGNERFNAQDFELE